MPTVDQYVLRHGRALGGGGAELAGLPHEVGPS
jgi:hypothetical protein